MAYTSVKPHIKNIKLFVQVGAATLGTGARLGDQLIKRN